MFKDLWDHRLAMGAARSKTLKAELAKISEQVESSLTVSQMRPCRP
ncbi:MAG: hypothetical protein ABN482_04025 [Corticimicrobacter sp.]